MVEHRGPLNEAEVQEQVKNLQDLHTCPLYEEVAKMSLKDTLTSYAAVAKALPHAAEVIMSGAGQAGQYFRFSIHEYADPRGSALLRDIVDKDGRHSGRCADITRLNEEK